MIIDKLENADRYIAIHPRFRKAFRFLQDCRIHALPPGKIDLDGGYLFATISCQPGRKREQAALEAHRKYIDIHYSLEGKEIIGWKPAGDCQSPQGTFDTDCDVVSYADDPVSCETIDKGSFAVYFPEDAHAPLVSEGIVHKAVVKIAI